MSCSKELFLKACMQNDLQLVRDMLARGADPNWRNEEGDSGLHLAVSNNHTELLDVFLSQTGINVNITDHLDCTTLMIACDHHQEEIVRRLLGVPGIEVNRVSERGPTAAHLAGGECLKALTEDKRVDWNLMNGWRHR